MAEKLSKSKAKRLKAKARRVRITALVQEEKKQHARAEDEARIWKEKATTCKRKIQEIQMKQMLSQRHSTLQRPSNPYFASTRVSCMSQATPSKLKAVPISVTLHNIPGSLLVPAEHLNNSTLIGSGCFGSCLRMVYKDLYPVCVKTFEPSTTLASIRSEAGILSRLDTDYTPHCFGICEDKRAIVMSCITLNCIPITLGTFLTSPPEGISLSSALALQILLDVGKGLQCIHTAGFLHNDLKSDNIVLGNSATTKRIKAYIIDFGKACAISSGKRYQLSPEQISAYKQEHPQIAPDLRDGKTSQSPATDVYSLGRVIRKLNQKVVHSEDLAMLQKHAMRYSSCERPTLTDIVTNLQSFCSS